MQEGVEGSDDPMATLSQNGVSAPDSAVHYLTPAQLEAVCTDMADMEDSLSYEVSHSLLLGMCVHDEGLHDCAKQAGPKELNPSPRKFNPARPRHQLRVHSIFAAIRPCPSAVKR